MLRNMIIIDGLKDIIMKTMFDKIVTIIFFTGIFTLVSCDNYYDNDETKTKDGLWLNLNDKAIIYTSDIDFYDISAHTIYLKKKIEYYGIVYVNVGKYEIYNCPVRPTHSSAMPQGGVYIWGSPFIKEDIIRFSFVQALNENHEPIYTDPRNDERIIEALKKYGQYREGLIVK